MMFENNNNEETSFNVKPTHSRYLMIRENIFHALSHAALAVYMALRFEADYSKETASLKRNIKSIVKRSGVKRTKCFDALNELENVGLLKRVTEAGYQSTYWIAQELGFFLPKKPQELPIPEPEKPKILPPDPDKISPVPLSNEVVQSLDNITINSSHYSFNLKPYVDLKAPRQLKEYEKDVTFMAFYSIYPHKQKPSIARMAFYRVAKSLKLEPKELLDIVLDDVPKRMANNWALRDKSKIPFPSSYLNSKEWEGELCPAEQPSNKKQGSSATKYKTWDEIIGDYE